MQINRNIIIAILFLLVGCKKPIAKENIKSKIYPSEVKTPNKTSEKVLNLDKMIGKSFVLSCGSGCPMTYIAKHAVKNAQNVSIKFNVEMYIDQTISETYDENYIFYYNKLNQLVNIKRVGQNEDFLESQSANAQNSFKKFANDLSEYLVGNSNGSGVIQENKNTFTFPIVMEKISILDYPYSSKYDYIKIDGNKPTSVLEIDKNTFIIWFDGDYERWYLVTVDNNKIVDKLLIGKSETVKTEDGTVDNYINFNIDKNLNIILEYSTGQGFASRKVYKKEKYFTNKGKHKIEGEN